MRLKAEQLAAHLARAGLAPVYYLSGDEPLQMMEAADHIRQAARQQGVGERVILELGSGFDWTQLHQEAANMSLFASRRLIELRLGEQKPGREGAAALVEYGNRHKPAAQDPEHVLLITGAKIDKRTQQSKWFKALDALGVTVQLWPLAPGRLVDWITQRMQQQGKHIQPDAAALIAQRVEGNLLAARQELEKLCLLCDKADIDSSDVMNSVADSARFDVFSLIECAWLGRHERSARMLRGLKNEGVEAIAVFAALMWEFRRSYVIAHEIAAGRPAAQVFTKWHVWPQRRPALQALLKRLHPQKMDALLRRAAVIDKILKGAAHGDAWQEMECFLFSLAGTRLASATI